MSKILVAYFSATGTTAGVAREIARALNADLFDIKPVKPYTSADLNWTDKKSRSSVEMNDASSRPAIIAPDFDLSQYDTVFLGFPIWWSLPPRVIDTFLESADFSGKTLIAFATSGGSGLGEAERHVKSLASQAHWQKGRLLNGSGIANWARKAAGL